MGKAKSNSSSLLFNIGKKKKKATRPDGKSKPREELKHNGENASKAQHEVSAVISSAEKVDEDLSGHPQDKSSDVVSDVEQTTPLKPNQPGSDETALSDVKDEADSHASSYTTSHETIDARMVDNHVDAVDTYEASVSPHQSSTFSTPIKRDSDTSNSSPQWSLSPDQSSEFLRRLELAEQCKESLQERVDDLEHTVESVKHDNDDLSSRLIQVTLEKETQNQTHHAEKQSLIESHEAEKASIIENHIAETNALKEEISRLYMALAKPDKESDADKGNNHKGDNDDDKGNDGRDKENGSWGADIVKDSHAAGGTDGTKDSENKDRSDDTKSAKESTLDIEDITKFSECDGFQDNNATDATIVREQVLGSNPSLPVVNSGDVVMEDVVDVDCNTNVMTYGRDGDRVKIVKDDEDDIPRAVVKIELPDGTFEYQAVPETQQLDLVINNNNNDQQLNAHQEERQTPDKTYQQHFSSFNDTHDELRQLKVDFDTVLMENEQMAAEIQRLRFEYTKNASYTGRILSDLSRLEESSDQKDHDLKKQGEKIAQLQDDNYRLLQSERNLEENLKKFRARQKPYELKMRELLKFTRTYAARDKDSKKAAKVGNQVVQSQTKLIDHLKMELEKSLTLLADDRLKAVLRVHDQTMKSKDHELLLLSGLVVQLQARNNNLHKDISKADHEANEAWMYTDALIDRVRALGYMVGRPKEQKFRDPLHHYLRYETDEGLNEADYEVFFGVEPEDVEQQLGIEAGSSSQSTANGGSYKPTFNNNNVHHQGTSYENGNGHAQTPSGNGNYSFSYDYNNEPDEEDGIIPNSQPDTMPPPPSSTWSYTPNSIYSMPPQNNGPQPPQQSSSQHQRKKSRFERFFNQNATRGSDNNGWKGKEKAPEPLGQHAHPGTGFQGFGNGAPYAFNPTPGGNTSSRSGGFGNSGGGFDRAPGGHASNAKWGFQVSSNGFDRAPGGRTTNVNGSFGGHSNAPGSASDWQHRH